MNEIYFIINPNHKINYKFVTPLPAIPLLRLKNNNNFFNEFGNLSFTKFLVFFFFFCCGIWTVFHVGVFTP